MDEESEQTENDQLNNPPPEEEINLSPDTGKAIGANTDYLSAQSFIFQESGTTFLYLIAGAGEDAFSQIKRVGLDCRDNIFSTKSEVAQIIPEAVEFIETELKNLDKIQIVAAVVKNNILYCLVKNGGYIYLQRRQRLIEISKNATSGKLISGLIQPGDHVLILNSQIDDAVSMDEELKKPWDPVFVQDLLETPPSLLEEEIEAYLQRFSLQNPIAVASLQIPAEVTEEEKMENAVPAILHEPHPQPRAPFLPWLLIKELLSSRRVKLIFAVIVIVLILVAVFGISKLRSNSQKNAQIQTLLTSSKNDLNQAMLNKDNDVDGARAALLKAKQELQAALKIDPKNSQALDLQSRINTQSGAILKEYDVNNWPVLLDLNLIKDGFSSPRLSFSLGKMALFDPKQKTLVVLNVADKNSKILSGLLQLGNAQFASINGDNVFVYSQDKGVVRVDVGNGKADVVVKPDPQWQRISDIVGFANNIYLLDEFKNQVWKYIATETGFSDRNNYLKDDATADFAGIRKMQIDGSIWVLKSNNTILKYIQGGNDFFAFQGFEVPMDNVKSFYVSDDTDNIYFLDNDHGRVVITKKNGQYLSQYSGDKFKTADDLAVDETAKKIYLLEGGKIYTVELQ